MIDTACEVEDDLYGGHIVYAVPDSWEVEGRGSSGTGITLDGDVDHRFRTSDGGVTVAFDRDQRDEESRTLDPDGEPSESFDHTIVDFDGDEKRVTHTEFLDTTVGKIVEIAVRALRWERLGADLSQPLREDEIAWLDAELG